MEIERGEGGRDGMVFWGVVDTCFLLVFVLVLEFILVKNIGVEILFLEILIEKGWGGN